MSTDRSLLVVDDESVVGQSCRRIFEPLGFRVDAATDPREGLKMAAAHPYAALLLDMKMNGMDGLQVLEQVHADQPALPIVIITGHPSVASATDAMRRGARDYLAKPFTPEEITAAVNRLVAAAAGPLQVLWAPPAGDPSLESCAQEAASASILPKTLSRLSVTNRKRSTVTMLIAGEALRADRGLGLSLIRAILDGSYPLQLTYGASPLDGARLREESAGGDRLLLLRVEDMGQPPGTLVREADLVRLGVPAEAVSKTTAMVLQPGKTPDNPLVFGPAVTAGLTRYLVEEMTQR